MTKPNCHSLFEESEGRSIASDALDTSSLTISYLAESAATQRATQMLPSQQSTQPSSRVLRRGETEIPSTHPDEGVSDSPSQQSVEPAAPAGKTVGLLVELERLDTNLDYLQLLKRRAGGKVNPFTFDMSSDEDEPPVKRTRSQAPATLPSQVPNTQMSATDPVPIEKATVSVLAIP